MKRYIKTSTGATDIVRDLYDRMPNELDFIDERDRPDGRIDLIFEVTSRFKHEAEDICKALIGEGLDARMGRNNRIIIAAPEDEDVESCDNITASVDWDYYDKSNHSANDSADIDPVDQVISKLGDIIDELSAHDDEQSRDIRDYLTQVSENIKQYRSRNYE